MTQTIYSYAPKSYISSSIVYNMLFNKGVYWLASRGTSLSYNVCDYRVYDIYGATLTHCDIYDSGSSIQSQSYKMMPIVNLKTNIQTTGQDVNGVWQLDV